ncbi:MAG: MFS transporter, partial [Pseudomonadota bacterium]
MTDSSSPPLHTTDVQPATPRLTLGVLAAYAAPNLALAALYFPVFVYLAPFYAAERGVPLAIIGAILIGGRLLDAVTDPLMGVISDRWTTRFGRRKIWLAAATPVTCVAVWMAMVPPEDAGATHAAIWLTALTLAWTVALTPYQAWGAELATDYAGRGRVSGWREAAFLIGTLGAAVIYFVAGGGGSGLRAVAIAVVASLPLLTLWALLGAPEPKDRSVRPVSWREGWPALRDNRPFRLTLASQFVNSAANALPAALYPFFVTQVLGADQQTVGGLLVLYFLAAVAAIPFWTWAAARWSKHRAWGAGMIYASLVFATVPFLGEGDVFAFAVITLLTGLAFGADIALPPAIQADVVDVDTAASGSQRTGLYFAFWSVATKAAAVSAGVGAVALDWVGFQETGENGPEALLALTLLYSVVPIVLKIWSVLMIWSLP